MPTVVRSGPYRLYFFSSESFHVFDPGHTLYPHCSRARFAVESCRLVLWKPYRWLGISWLANRFRPRYEKMFAFLFPSQYLEFRLRTLPLAPETAPREDR